MPETPSKMHIYDMKIDAIVFEIRGGGVLLKLPHRIVCCLKYPRSDRVKGVNDGTVRHCVILRNSNVIIEFSLFRH